MAKTLSLEQAGNLIELCKKGQLYEVEKWLTSGLPCQVPAECKHKPLVVAVETGFHSLVELLLRYENDQTIKNQALAAAVSKKRLDILSLLIRGGADVRSVSLTDVFLTWEPAIMRFFLSQGADPIKDESFAEAFQERIKTALGVYREYRRQHPELAEKLQGQADRALRLFAKEGNLKWVCLILWAGANPRAAGPTEWDDEEPDEFLTAFKEASYHGHVEILKKLKPDPTRDNISEMVRCAAFVGRLEAVKYLVQFGADLNDKPNGGSSAVDGCFSHFRFEDLSRVFQGRERHLASRYSVSESIEMLQELIKYGARWEPNDSYEMNSVRRTLLELEPDCCLEIIALLVAYDACSQDTLIDLLRTPRIREHLADCQLQLRRVLPVEVFKAVQASGKRTTNRPRPRG